MRCLAYKEEYVLVIRIEMHGRAFWKSANFVRSRFSFSSWYLIYYIYFTYDGRDTTNELVEMSG